MSKLKTIAIGTLLSASCVFSKQDKKPNILFIMSDDHTSQAIGAYKSRLAKLNPTPNIDKLAENGILFENAFCTNSICTPSRACIITGQYSQTNGILSLSGKLPKSKHYLPQEMKNLGYETAMVGKWHLKAEPNFDYYNVLPLQGKYFNPVFRVQGDKKWPKNISKHKGHSSDVITDITLKWLKSRKDDKPFFLMHHYKAPHDMFHNAPRYDDYLKDVEIPEPKSLYSQPHWGSESTRGRNDSLRHIIGTSIGRRHHRRNYADYFKIDKSLSDKEAKHQAYQAYLKRYLRCVKGIDDNLKRLFDYLKKSGQWENTIIIYTGDQGFMLGEHDFMDKRWMYEESMRMPFIVHYPEMIKANQRTDVLINNTDFAPTIIEMAGGKTPKYMQGKSFAPVLQNKKFRNQRKSTYYRYWMHMIHHENPAHFGIRTKYYKLIFFYGASMHDPKVNIGKRYPLYFENTPPGWEFYDLKNDPHEMVNQYNNKKYAKIIKKLKKELKKTRKKIKEEDTKYPKFQKIIDENWN